MEQISVPAFFMRGGTSKGLFFRAGDLPAERDRRDRFLLAAMGSPDPHGRQLDGMGGGVSSLSKAMIVARSARPGVDVEYAFAQVSVGDAFVDYGGNCGNLSAAVGVFAIEAGLVSPPDGPVTVRMLNLNGDKRVDCHLEIAGGHARVTGDTGIAGVAGTGAPIRLDFLEPGGATTGRLLPTGAPLDTLTLSDGSKVTASIVDASNLCVFVRAADLGLAGTELPSELRGRVTLMARLEEIRAQAAVAAGLAGSAREATRRFQAVPKIAMVAAAAEAPTLSGQRVRREDCNIQVRMLSMGLPHLAIPLTGALCVAVAARIPGTLAHECACPMPGGAALNIGHGSGVLPVWPAVTPGPEAARAERVSVVRTARVLMRGEVFAPAAAELDSAREAAE